MKKVKYKEFTKEEEKIYDDVIEALRKNVQDGMKFDEACLTIDVQDEELKKVIADDFLKICIAEMHHVKRMSFEDISKALDVPVERLVITYRIMLDDVMNTHKSSIDFSKEESLKSSEPEGNA